MDRPADLRAARAAGDGGFGDRGRVDRLHASQGLGELMAAAPLRQRVDAAKLVHEHEMGELFKAIAFAKGLGHYAPLGFTSGDRRHRL